MKIGVIGIGNVGGSLVRRWDLTGHDILIGVRDPHSEKVQILSAVTQAQVGSISEAVAFGDVVVIATPWNAVADVVASSTDWAGKIVIDTMNRFSPPPPNSLGSASEDLAHMLTGANVVKAFNTLGAELLLNPQFGDETASLFICGDNESAKRVVTALAEEISYDVVDCGPLSNAAQLEAMAKLWVWLARNMGNRDFAFKLLKR